MTSTDKAPERIWAWDDKTPTERDKGWSACDAGTGSTEYVSADLHEAARAVIARLADERDQAINALSKAAEARGRAEGKLEVSELPGIVDGWKTRAEKAEADLNEGKREADYLANVLWERHYKNKSPNFELLNTISGVVSQIDNMVAGIIADHDAAVAEVEFFKGEIKLRNRIPSTSDTLADLQREIERLKSERDTALAQVAAVIEQAAQAAYQWWDDDDAQELRQHIRILTPADARAALTQPTGDRP